MAVSRCTICGNSINASWKPVLGTGEFEGKKALALYDHGKGEYHHTVGRKANGVYGVTGCVSQKVDWAIDAGFTVELEPPKVPTGDIAGVQPKVVDQQVIVPSDVAAKAEQALNTSLQVASQFGVLGQQMSSETRLYKDYYESLLEAFKKLDGKWESKLNAKQEITITVNNGVTVDVGRQHRLFTKLVRIVLSVRGQGVVFLTGEPGSMKTSVIPPLAMSLGTQEAPLPFYVVSMNNQTARSELLGYMNGHGEYVPSPAYWACKDGGVVLYDEVDASNANGLTGLNTFATNDFVGFPNGEVVKKHPKCYILAAGNTIGAGGDTKFIGRNQLDLASRTRFVYLEWNTDWDLVAEIVKTRLGVEDWARKVQWLNVCVTRRNIQFVVSSRVALVGSSMISDGFSEAEVLESMLWPNLSTDEIARVKQEYQEFENEIAALQPVSV